MGKTISIRIELDEVVEIWRGGDWQALTPSESLDIIRKRDACIRSFNLYYNGGSYVIDLEAMTRTDREKGRVRSIRFTLVETMQESGMWDLDKCKESFCHMATAVEDSQQILTEDDLLRSWPGAVVDDELLSETVREVMRSASLRHHPGICKEEWLHYWALQMEEPSSSLVAELNDRLRVAIQYDPKVLERMQAIFEAFGAVVPGATNRLVLPLDGLIEACHAMEEFPDQVMEKYWAQDILRRHAQGQLALEEDEELTYHDFLSVMLGRRRQKVYLLMYDITDGRAHSWLWLLGPQFRAFWHTGVMVEFAEKPSEFWYGGKVFCSTPCTTPFGQPIEKRFMGYTYKSREEVIHHIGIDLAHEFHKNAYDALTHNCNHFSDKLMMYLTNEHLPEEILKQPELVLNSPAVQLARPFLNRWLGEFHAKGEVANEQPMEVIQADLGPSALVSFSRREGGLGLIGRVESFRGGDQCVITSLDFWRRCAVERCLPKARIGQILDRGLQRARSIPDINDMLMNSARGSDGRSCCWLPNLLARYVTSKEKPFAPTSPSNGKVAAAPL